MIANSNAQGTQQREQQMSDAVSHSAGWRPATYYPDPAIHALDPRFEKYWLKLSAVERLTTGLRWAKVGSGSAMGVSRISSRRAAQDGWNPHQEPFQTEKIRQTRQDDQTEPLRRKSRVVSASARAFSHNQDPNRTSV